MTTNRTLAVLLLPVLLFVSCYRSSKILPPPTPPKYDVLVNHYNLKDGIGIVYLYDSSSAQLNISLTRKSGNPANFPIRLSLDNIPSGISISPKDYDVMLDTSFNLTVEADIDTGIYTINVKVSDTVNGQKIYPLQIKVLPAMHVQTDCRGCFERNWTCLGDCGGADSCHPMVSLIPGMPNWIRIRNINCLGDSVVVDAYISCTEGIRIPPQTSNGYTISGGRSSFPCGYYVAYSIPDTIIHNGVTRVCNFFIRGYQ